MSMMSRAASSGERSRGMKEGREGSGSGRRWVKEGMAPCGSGGLRDGKGALPLLVLGGGRERERKKNGSGGEENDAPPLPLEGSSRAAKDGMAPCGSGGPRDEKGGSSLLVLGGGRGRERKKNGSGEGENDAPPLLLEGSSRAVKDGMAPPLRGSSSSRK